MSYLNILLEKYNNNKNIEYYKMFQELLDQLDETIKQAKTTANTTQQQMNITKQQFGIQNQKNYFHDPTHSYGKAHSFGKTNRFKPLQKQQPKTTDSYLEITEISQTQKKANKFSKSERFQKDKADQQMILNPNFEVIKANNKKAPIMKKDQSSKLDQSRASIFTAASQSDVGPAKYFINETQQIRPQKNCAFSKQKRFKQQKPKYEGIPLYVNQNQTKKRPPSSAVLKPKTKNNTKLISKMKQQQLRQRLKMVYWKSIPIQLDRLLKKNINGPVIRDTHFDLKKMEGTQKRCAILMLLDRFNYERGGLDYNISKDISKDTGCQVIYRKSTPKPFKFSQMEPGPDYYYPRDDLTKPNHEGYTFAKQQQKAPQKDNRDYEVNQQIFKKGGNIIINKQHKPHKLTEEEIRNINRGPGYYDCLFRQVEKRDDIGIVKFAQINQKNARENNCIETKQVNDALYIVKYDAIDPNKPAPLYRQPANIKPQHLPQKQLFPEHWLFYDGDLKKVRAEIAKNVLLAQGMNFEEYKTYTQKFKVFKQYLEQRRRIPQSLQYQVKYDQIDAHIQGFQMDKKPQKTLIDPITKDEFDVDGDNLILQPEKPKPKLPDIAFKKMIGRDQQDNDPDIIKEGDRLILNPKQPQKHIPQIDFNKQVDRPQIINEQNMDEQPREGDVVRIDPKIPENKIANIDFKKQSSRPEIKTKAEEDDPPENIINVDKPKKIKGFVQMKRMTAAKLVPILRKKKQSVIKFDNH